MTRGKVERGQRIEERNVAVALPCDKRNEKMMEVRNG